ncbi:alpha/beta fold hydrolase [Nocardia stercoris]|uniref:Alpha/beta hydrolase n=1 Tax=Nocardia stercoris TaxID=2483361 RepID=A0A3M2LCD1_9NOCA|nr:alpha/beta hydrolase [Nocardia stercoris]RMI33635.1 alpha/beta hydrolase [Nocardia stercoris]
MPMATVNGISINYQVRGDAKRGTDSPRSAPLVLLVMGTGSPGRVWELYQVPALLAAGYRVCTFDNRGIAPSDECADGITQADMVADTAALIEFLDEGPVLIAGTSFGARIAQELALTRPELIRRAVLMGAHARVDAFQATLSAGERDLDELGIVLPPRYQSALTAALNMSPATMADQDTALEWLDLFEFSDHTLTPGLRAQRRMNYIFDRVEDYRAITVPCLSVAFADDRMIPPFLSREVAEIIPDAQYAEIPDAGHFGYLERPDAINELMIEFFRADESTAEQRPI